MSDTFNIDEIFEIALQMEKNGVEFYRKAAAESADPKIRELLTDLAEMELEHQKTFTKLRNERVESNESARFYDPNGEAALFLKAMADTRAFFEREIDLTSPREILKEAIQAEKDSIALYLGMKEIVPNLAEKTQMDSIIDEEKSHIRFLSRKLLEWGPQY